MHTHHFKAISFKAKVLIMDEPTAALTYTEVKLLADLISELKEIAKEGAKRAEKLGIKEKGLRLLS